MNKIFRIPSMFLAASVLMLAGCVNEKDGNEGLINTNGNLVIRFTVDGSTSQDTKAALPKQTGKTFFNETEDGDQLFLIRSEQSLDNMYAISENTSTKGTPVYTENFPTVIGEFAGIPYAFDESSAPTQLGSSDGNPYIGLFHCIDKKERTYEFDFGENSEWPDGKKLLFYLSAPSTQPGCKNIGYSYVAHEGLGYNGIIDFDYTSPATADAQVDVLFTSKSISEKDYLVNNHDNSKILFYHVLAGVKFKSNNAEYEANDGSENYIKTVINSVEITNVLTQGHCTVTPAYDPAYNNNNSNAKPDVNKSKLCAIWNESKTTPVNFMLTLAEEGVPVEGMGVVSPSEGQFPAAFDGSNEFGSYNLNDEEYSNTFFFIPQITGNDVELHINYSILTYDDKGNVIANKTKTYDRFADFSNQTWEAGCLYTYTLSANKVDVDYSDTMTNENKVKQEPTIQNTGNTDVYIRCAIVANWFDGHTVKNGNADYQISAPCEEWTEAGAIDRDLDLTNWYKGSDDGFYYYKYKVKPGEYILHPLFNKFTVGDCIIDGKKQTNVHLEINIATQAVDANKISKVTGWDTSGISTDPEYDN